MSSPSEFFDETYEDILDRVSKMYIGSDDATVAVKNLETLSKCREPLLQPRPTSDVEPSTILGKVKAGVVSTWDNETTRVFIKAGGAFAGVALVVWSTIHRDHVVEKTALQQANQRPS